MKLKELLSKVASWIFVGLTSLGVLFIYAGFGGGARYRLRDSGDINYYFIAIGLVLIIPSLILLFQAKIIQKKSEKEEEQRISDLISFGDRIIVNLDDLEIQSNSYKQEIEVGSGYNTRNEFIDINHNVILVHIPYQNEFISYKLNIYMDPTKLKMHFAIKKETEFYVDPEDVNNNYLDLSFLED